MLKTRRRASNSGPCDVLNHSCQFGIVYCSYLLLHKACVESKLRFSHNLMKWKDPVSEL